MSEGTDQLRINREALVTMPSSKDEKYIAIRQNDFDRIIQDINKIAEPSHWFRDLCLLCTGVCITAIFSLWLQSTSLLEVDQVKHWAIIIGSGIFAVLCFFFDWNMKRITVSKKQSIIDEMKELCVRGPS